MSRAPTYQDDQQALALASAAWAFLDAESRGIGTEVQAALTVFQASWGQWSDSLLLGEAGAAPPSLRMGSWDVDTRNAIRMAVGVVLVGMGAFSSASEANGVLDSMPRGVPPDASRGTWFVLNLGMRVPESSTDPTARTLWGAARAIRGRGIDAGADLSRRTFEIAMGVPTGATTAGAAAAANANQQARDLIATAQSPVVHEIEAPGGGPFVIPGLAPRPQSEIPWTPIIIGGGIALLGAGLAVAWSSGALTRRRGMRGLGWQITSHDPHPLRDAERQSRW